ncbi:MAG: hypothetical protein ACI4RC_05320 [Oscillospiraceae bacterium]
MIFYHGSPVGGLNELKPFLSEHGKPYIYFSTNPLIALLYAVKPVPKPFSFYPYGFNENGNIVYSEYFENAFYDLYKGKSGYLYECNDLKNIDTLTQINCAYTYTKSIRVDKETKIPDLYVFYKEQEEKGLFRVKPKIEVSAQEMQFVFNELRKDIEKYDLKSLPQHPMSIFIRNHFSVVWNANG